MTISCKAKGDTMKIEYTKVGDYYLPNLYYPEETRPIGLWGMLRKEYLKEHKSGTYTYLLLTARLDSYLRIDYTAGTACLPARRFPTPVTLRSRHSVSGLCR